MNAVHEHHRPEQFAGLTHFVFAFHDTTFECVAADVQISIHPGDQPLTLARQITHRTDRL